MTEVNMSFIDCCTSLGGFINKTIYITDLSVCLVGNVCNCSINNNLKILLTLLGIKF